MTGVSRHLGDLHVRGLLKAGDLMIPGGDGLHGVYVARVLHRPQRQRMRIVQPRAHERQRLGGKLLTNELQHQCEGGQALADAVMKLVAHCGRRVRGRSNSR